MCLVVVAAAAAAAVVVAGPERICCWTPRGLIPPQMMSVAQCRETGRFPSKREQITTEYPTN